MNPALVSAYERIEFFCRDVFRGGAKRGGQCCLHTIRIWVAMSMDESRHREVYTGRKFLQNESGKN